MLSVISLFVNPLIAHRKRLREQAIDKLHARIQFLSNALDSRMDFSGTHRFPQWIDDASNKILNLDPSSHYAISIRTRLLEFRARAAEIIAMRFHALATQALPAEQQSDI